jgi:mannitol 2-dehydrogenase
MADIFGALGADAGYVEAFSHALDTIWSIGTKATLEAYLADRL